MKKQLVAALAAVTVCVALPAAAQNLAIVNGKPVPQSRADVLAAQVTKAGQPLSPEIKDKIKEELVTREIFAQEAQRRGLDANPEFKTQMDMARQALLIRALLADFQQKNTVSDEEAKAAYDKFVAANTGKEYHAHHILVPTEAQAKAIIAQLKKGAKFEDIAKKQSKDTGSAAHGGDLDWATASTYVPEFSEALVKLKKGETTQVPVKTQFGWHVIRLDDIRDAQLPKFDEVKPQIKQQLMQEKLEKFQEELRAKAKVE